MAGTGFLPGDQGSPVEGAPYSATMVNESTQTLADGNRIVQRFTGTTARDSQGRTRQETALPSIGNMSAANTPQLVFIQDPVAQTAYTLNLTDKTAHKMPTPLAVGAVTKAKLGTATVSQPNRIAAGGVATAAGGAFFQKQITVNEQAEVHTENLGIQTMQGVSVEGVRTTRTIAAGEIDNDRPIEIVTPPGTIVNVQRPAPAGSHGEIRKRVIACMVGALSQIAPEKIAGDLCRTSFHNLIGGFDPRSGREWAERLADPGLGTVLDWWFPRPRRPRATATNTPTSPCKR